MPEVKLEMNEPTTGTADNGISSADVHPNVLLTNYVDSQNRPLDEEIHKQGQRVKNP